MIKKKLFDKAWSEPLKISSLISEIQIGGMERQKERLHVRQKQWDQTTRVYCSSSSTGFTISLIIFLAPFSIFMVPCRWA